MPPLDQGARTLSQSSAIYGVVAVERMTGVPAATIRAWQDRFGQSWGTAGPGEEILYSRDDVESILAFSRQQGHEPAGSAEPSPAEEKSGARLLVLLAERDEYAAELTEYFLRTEGYGVESVFDADEALRRHEQVAPDLAIVELLIDGGAGFELCRRLREKGTCPVVAISALEAGDLAGEVDALLRKPLAPLELITTVRDLLGTSAMLGRQSA